MKVVAARGRLSPKEPPKPLPAILVPPQPVMLPASVAGEDGTIASYMVPMSGEISDMHIQLDGRNIGYVNVSLTIVRPIETTGITLRLTSGGNSISRVFKMNLGDKLIFRLVDVVQTAKDFQVGKFWISFLYRVDPSLAVKFSQRDYDAEEEVL